MAKLKQNQSGDRLAGHSYSIVHRPSSLNMGKKCFNAGTPLFSKVSLPCSTTNIATRTAATVVHVVLRVLLCLSVLIPEFSGLFLQQACSRPA